MKGIYRNLGCYGALNPQNDFPVTTQQTLDAGFKGWSVFINADRWTQPPDKKKCKMPWVYDSVRDLWDMLTPNPEYFAMVREMTSNLFKRNLDLSLKIHTQYHLRYWNKFTQMKQKSHPYFSNNFHFDAGGDPANQKALKMIYDSIHFGPLGFDWLAWKDVNEAQNKFLFSAANNFGAAIMVWISSLVHQMATDFKAARLAGSTSRLTFAINNEEIAEVVGDRSPPFVWLREQFVKEGLTPAFGTEVVSVVNRQPEPDNPNWVAVERELYAGNPAKRTGGITTAYGIAYGLGSLQEIHVDGVADAQRFINVGCKKNRLFMSNDGTPKDPKTFLAESKKFWTYGGNDFIYDESVFNPDPFPPFRWMANWNKSFPGMAQIPQ